MSLLRIVVADDDDSIRFIVCAVAQEGVPCASIGGHASGLPALQEVEDGADLLITDCHMPEMDGPSLVRAIRKMKNLIPIIMISASQEARRLGEKAGIDRFVEKIHLNAELGGAIQTCLTAA